MQKKYDMNKEREKKLNLYRLVIDRNKLQALKNVEVGDFNYALYLEVNNNVVLEDTKCEITSDKVEVVHLIVARNVYNNEVIKKRDGAESYIFIFENSWLDSAPFDDYSVLCAKKFMDRFLGSMNVGDFNKELRGKTSLKVSGAYYSKRLDKVYVLTQIIFPDSFVNCPSNLVRKKIYTLDEVIHFGEEINEAHILEPRVFASLSLV